MFKQELKKILFIVQLPPPVHGASIMNSYVVNSVKLNSNFKTNLINLQFAKSIKELRKFSFLKIYKSLIYCIKISKKVLFFKPDIVYFTLSPFGFAFYRDSIYILLLKLLGVEIVFHLHGKGINKNAQSNLLNKFLYKWVFNNTYVICLSEILTYDINAVYKNMPFIVPNGIQEQNKNESVKSRINRSVPKILFLSNYKLDKGILVLIEALEILKKKGCKFDVRLVGAPSDISINALQQIIQNKELAEFVQVTGPLYGKDKIKEFVAADIFVFPTFYKNEAFPLVILEAFQYALPVISTFEGGIPNIITDNETGFLVEKQNPLMLADRIAILLESEELRLRMGQKAYAEFENKYTLTKFETAMNKTLQSILDIKNVS